MAVRVLGARAAVPLLAAAVLGGIAVATVEQAGCTDPGHYVAAPGGGYTLVGGCFDPADLMVPDVPGPTSEPAPVPARG